MKKEFKIIEERIVCEICLKEITKEDKAIYIEQYDFHKKCLLQFLKEKLNIEK